MATLKEQLVTILQTDAQDNTAGRLGALLGKSATAPYGIYYQNPPAEPDSSFITYHINFMTDNRPRMIFMNITAWGDNFEAIQNRIYALLHREAGLNSCSFVGVTDYTMQYFEWESALPELYDDDLRIYHQTHRFLAKGWKT